MPEPPSTPPPGTEFKPVPLGRHHKCQIMGILNITSDSFFDGGRYLSIDAAVQQAAKMAAEGADIIDVGGESTRPGAARVTADEEIDRVVPVIERLRQEFDLPVSIDTSKPEVMRLAVAAGASMINDVYALRLPGALQAAAELQVPVCLMHMQGEPGSMQVAPQYTDVVTEVMEFLDARINACEAAGIARELLMVDPGFGFGKNLGHNLALLHSLDRFNDFGLPVLVGCSRKSMLGQILNRPDGKVLIGSVALALIARQRGASIIRVHDVAETIEALTVLDAVEKHV